MAKLKIAALVTNCSARKSVAAAESPNVLDLTMGNQDAVAQQWMASLARAPKVASASDLYTGRGVKRMRRLANQLDAPFYIVSAGLGLVRATDEVPNYDLSVSAATPKAVQRRVTGSFSANDWWAAVQQSTYAHPIRKLFRGDDDQFVLIAVSNAYVPLLVAELEELSTRHRTRLRLFGSMDAKYPSTLRMFLMPYDSRLDELVPGSKVDFAQRAAEHFIAGALAHRDFPVEVDQQREWVEARLNPVMPKRRPKREAVDDGRIREFAREFARQGLSYTSALNRLRKDRGIACEQSRFRRLFLEATT